ncbi:MAG TPA: hypothetical protein VD902_02395, partial [Symbiobacteriaceae bacterium]|nr:hypothetical protein [Symbiobacteriaceae bacterium]
EPAQWSPGAPTLAVETTEGVGVAEVTARGPGPVRLIAKGWSGPSWSHDGHVLAVTQNRHGKPFTGESAIGLVSASGGQVKVVWQDPYRQDAWVGPVAEVKWSADGRWLAFYRGALSASLGMDSNQLTVLPAVGGEATALTSGPINRSYFSWAPEGARLAFTGGGGGRSAWLDKQVNLVSMPPTPPYRSLTPQGYADREPA